MLNRRILILYGSQTGNSQEVAERIWRESKRFQMVGPVLPMDDYSIPNLIHETLVIFVCSTTGQGEQPDNMTNFWKFLLRKNLPSDSLQNVKFAVLGLGDSSYAKYNHVAKKLHKRLLTLGGEALCSVGLADEQHDLGSDAVVDPWIKKLWEKCCDSSHDLLEEKILPPARWNPVFENMKTDQLENTFPNDSFTKNSTLVKLLSNERVTTEDHFQDVRFMRFTSEKLSYHPGDVLVVKPHNCGTAVKSFLDLLSEREDNIKETDIIRVEAIYDDMPVPEIFKNPITIKELVYSYWNLNAVPRRYTFELLSYFTDSDIEREKLIEFTSPGGQEDLYNYCNRPKRTILEVLRDFPRAFANISLQYIFEIFQPIKPRMFSLASSPKMNPDQLHILVAVVKYRTIIKTPRIGLCSSWLASLLPNQQISVHIRHGSFSFPCDKYSSIIMVGPGTGIAPFRSYVQENVSETSNENQLCVFFGCRKEKADYYFKDEWKQLQLHSRIHVHTAFSRDQPKKIYVQDKIEEVGDLLSNLLLSENVFVFVAGNSKNMPDAVRKALCNVCHKYGKISEDSAEKLITHMEMHGKYQLETWS